MAYTREQYDRLIAAKASGAITIQYGDKIVNMRNLQEVNQIQAEMERDLGISKTRGRIRRASYSKGLQ